MSSVAAYDPGLRVSGLSHFDRGELQWAGLIRSPEKTVRGPSAWLAMALAVRKARPGSFDVFVSEVPQVYRTGRQKGDPADLIELAGVVGAVTSQVGAKESVGYFPREWIGQTPKDINNRRVLAALSSKEKERIEDCPASLLHNVLDGIGVGLFYLKEIGERP